MSYWTGLSTGIAAGLLCPYLLRSLLVLWSRRDEALNIHTKERKEMFIRSSHL